MPKRIHRLGATGLVLAWSWGLCSGAWAEEAKGEGAHVPVTITAGALQVCLDDVIFTQKNGYVHLLIDILPYAAQIKALQAVSLSSVAKALVLHGRATRFMDEKNFKVDVVEILGRDDYGAPRWDMIRVKERYWAAVDGKAIVLTPKKAAP